MTHDPLCEWSTPCIHGENQQHSRDTENLAVPDATYCWVCGVDCHCDLIAKVRADEREEVLTTHEQVPSGAFMEIACHDCGWDYGHTNDLLDLFAAYNEHVCHTGRS